MTQQLIHARKKHALTQTELAALIGVSQTSVGRIEAADEKTMSALRLKTALALHVVFGRTPAQIFHDLFASVEDAVMRQAAALDRALDGLPDRASGHKRALLSDMARRAGTRLTRP